MGIEPILVALITGITSTLSTAAVLKNDINWIKQLVAKNERDIEKVKNELNDHVKTH